MRRMPLSLLASIIAACVISSASIALAKINLPTTADTHTVIGIPCEGCHGEDAPGEVGMKTCFSCHGSYQNLIEATSGTGMNPHASHLYEPECVLCHIGHEPDKYLCQECHVSMTNAELHLGVGVGCSACHGKDLSKRDSVPMDTCLSCHGPYEDLADLTSTLEMNPHRSHFPYLDCNECHHGHTSDTNFCADCH